jgi:peroxiredoxin
MRRLAAAMLLVAVSLPAARAHAQAEPQSQPPPQSPSPARRRSGPPVAVLRSGPEVGRRAPDFTIPWASKDGVGPSESPYQLWGDLGKTVVLVFYSRAFTKSSEATLRGFTERYDDLFGPDDVVLAISTDPPETQGRFAARLGVPFRMLSDEGQRVAKKYGNADASGFIRRSVYVIGPDGKVQFRDMHFDPFTSKSYAAIGDAVRSTRTRGGTSR